jgi:hypothetical protein
MSRGAVAFARPGTSAPGRPAHEDILSPFEDIPFSLAKAGGGRKNPAHSQPIMPQGTDLYDTSAANWS